MCLVETSNQPSRSAREHTKPGRRVLSHSKHSRLRNSPLTPHLVMRLALLLLALAQPAEALKYSTACDNALTADDRAALENGADFLDIHRHDILREVRRARADGNPFNYVSISTSRHADWAAKLDRVLADKIKIRCHYTTMNSKCDANAPNTQGFVIWAVNGDWILDGIHLCMDNIRNSTSTGTATEFQAALTGTFAHEIMHYVDNNEGHGSDDPISNPQNPNSTPETIGIAAEHLMLTPQIKTSELASTSRSFGYYDHLVELTYLETNRNANAVSNDLAKSVADRNSGFDSCASVDGSFFSEEARAELNGSVSTLENLSVLTSGYEVGDPYRSILVQADCGDAHLEWDEADNVSILEYSTWVDLELGVELAAAPVFHSMEYRADADPPGYYNWFELTYQATVTNADVDTPANMTDLVVFWDDMWSRSSLMAKSSLMIRELAPGASRSVTFSIDVPALPSGTSPNGSITLHVFADGDAEDVHDRDRSNNHFELEIDANYWKPDYRVASLERLGMTGGSQSIAVSVKNMGPVSAKQESFIDITLGGLLEFRFPIRPLAPSEVGATHTFTLPIPICRVVTHHAEADATRLIAESDESNNAARISVGTRCPWTDLEHKFSSMRDLLAVEEILYGWESEHHDWTNGLPGQGLEIPDFVQWIFDSQSNGPFLPSIPENWFDHWQHIAYLEDGDSFTIFQLPMQPLVAPVSGRSAQTPAIPVPLRVNGNIWAGRHQLEQNPPPPGQSWPPTTPVPEPAATLGLLAGAALLRMLGARRGPTSTDVYGLGESTEFEIR